MKRIIFICLFGLILRPAFGSDVVHKSTLVYRKSVSTDKYLDGNWLINPALPNCAKKYWKLNGTSDGLLEMTSGEKAIVDQAIADTQAQRLADAKDIAKSLPKLNKALALLMLDEINKLRVKNGDTEYTVQQFITAIANKYDSL